MSSLPVLIIGGGISGLTVAYRLQKAGRPYLLLEKGSRLGGNIHTVEHDGFFYDVGPDSFLRTKTAGAELCKELGLGDHLISPSQGGTSVHVAFRGKLHPMPEGLTLGVPKRPWPILFTPLLSPTAKVRALLEPWIGTSRPKEEESIHEFMARRLGSEMAERLAAPLLSGVFAGDAHRLSMDAAFGQMIALEQKYGSLFSGMNGGKSVFQVLREKVAPHPSPFLSLQKGLGQMIDALARELPKECVRLHTNVERVAFDETTQTPGVIVDGQHLAGSHVVLAGPPWMAGRLLTSTRPTLGESLGGISGHQTATVFFGLEDCEADLSGSGFIVPPGEGEILAATYVSSKWAERAPEGRSLVRAFVGGARHDIAAMSDAQLQEVARRELTRFVGPLGHELFCRVYRYEKGTPQPELGHKARLSLINQEVADIPWLRLLGSGYGAVGIPDCIGQANQIAAELAA